ncbi:hypothetical protein TNCV_3857111 [Trichonephila clavipes]|nr:hypothetical protein TNCV_3857111 [Trichonephila clavipes]
MFVVTPIILTTHLYFSLLIKTIVLPCLNNIQGRVFQHDNTGPHNVVVTQSALLSVDMLPWPKISLDLSPIEHRMGYCWTTTPASSTNSTDRHSVDTTSTALHTT